MPTGRQNQDIGHVLKDIHMKEPLDAASLCKTFDLNFLSDAAILSEKDDIIGQPRAVKSLETGLNISHVGYNIFVSGAAGTGKLTAIKQFLGKRAGLQPAPSDWCYVNNFGDPYRPKIISLPAGHARNFRSDIKKLIDEARSALKKAFTSEEFSEHREAIVDKMKRKQNELFSVLDEEAKKENLTFRTSPMGIFIIPVKNGKAIDETEAGKLTDKEIKAIREKQEKFNKRLDNYLDERRKIEKAAQEEIDDLGRKAALFAIDALIRERKSAYQSLGDIVTYLDEIKEDILHNIPAFLDGESKQNQAKALFGGENDEESLLAKYDVNILTDNTDMIGAPLIIEPNPTFTNLVGKMEKESRFGALLTNFSLIKAGALHRANGGYLVLPALELLRNPLAYDSLKRCLKSKHIEIEEATDSLGILSAKTLKPEPVPLNIKVVLMGDSHIYSLLYELDNEFRELFKIKADFDTAMELNESAIKSYAGFIGKLVKEEKLLPAGKPAVERILQYGCRLTEHQEKLSTRFGKIADILREASYYAGLEGTAEITALHIERAIEEKFYRSNLLQEKLNDMTKEGSISIETEGERTGQVNGLSVIDIGDIAFGHPNKITVSTDMGRDGIIDIEREAKLGGPIHSKGVMILSGYLYEQFGKQTPVSISARIVFEQSYAGVDGDSASSTELYAILSSLGGIPIKQGIAVTGSVNQKGEVQAVGGINEKIEGYFEVCRLKGLTGNQGVIIPLQNVRHLMLKKNIIDAVNEKKFRIWAVNNIDEGIEILTGMHAGTADSKGEYEPNTVKFLVNNRLKEVTAKLKEFSIGQNGRVPAKAYKNSL